MTRDHEPHGPRVSRRDLGLAPLVAPLAAGAGLALAAAAGEASALAPARIGVADRFGIIDLFARYSWFYDCSDAEAYASVFTEDGVIEAFGQEAARGRANIAAFIRTLFAQRGQDIWQHRTDHLMFFQQDRGYRVYSYWSVLRRVGEEYGVMGVGYYVSDCLKQNHEWLLKRRAIFRWDSSKLPWA